MGDTQSIRGRRIRAKNKPNPRAEDWVFVVIKNAELRWIGASAVCDGCRVVLLTTLLAHDELEDEQQQAGADQAGDEAEDPATGTNAQEGEDPATQETTDDADDDVGWDAHLSISAHDLGANPAGQATNDDPAQEAKSGNAIVGSK